MVVADMDKMLFQKVKQKRVYHEVADQIEEAIVYGLLKPGQKIGRASCRERV